MGVLPLKSGSYNAEQGRGGMLMDDILQVNERLRGLIWGVPMLILLLGTGLYFTAVTGVFQVRYCALWLRKTLFSCFTGAARRTSGGVSPFAAMCTALAATVGTGNIAGVATALTLGGPGAVLWLWVSAFVGMMTAFAENTLGMLYRERGADGSWRGGAMLYLKNGLHSPLLAGAFALFCVLASFGIGNMSQCNSIAQGLSGSFGIPSGIVGAVTAVLLGAVLLGGLKRLSRVTETLVPFMALFYMGGAVVVLWMHRANLPQAFAQICSMAFDTRAGTGGVLGYGMTQAVRAGVSRVRHSHERGIRRKPLRARVRHAFAFSADNRCTAYRRGVLHRIRTVRRGLRCGVARAVCILDPARLVVLRAACSGLFDGGAGNSGLQGGLSSGGGSGLHDAAGAGVGAQRHVQRLDGAA